MSERTAYVERNTLETQVKVTINLDGTGKARFAIGVPFLEHMLDQIARHGLIDLDIECNGDLHIDDHHTVEDVGITLGQAFAKAIGDKKGMTCETACLCTLTFSPLEISTVIKLSSTSITFPKRPPLVTTSSPLANAATISLCCFARFC